MNFYFLSNDLLLNKDHVSIVKLIQSLNRLESYNLREKQNTFTNPQLNKKLFSVLRKMEARYSERCLFAHVRLRSQRYNIHYV